jgi:8-oxo-dGTP pyrophosphatase MutT (NUDIX family)
MDTGYKIYYKDSVVLIATHVEQSNKKFAKVLEGSPAIEKFISESNCLFEGELNENILLLTGNPGEVMCRLFENRKAVIAGGGIVWNENDELLMIHRRGKWDLPKGKIEPNEKIIDGAKREVEEETGIIVNTVHENAVKTFHAYLLKNKPYIKETSWFKMNAKPMQSKPVAQTEEDIDEVRWVGKTELKNYYNDCYPLIRDLIMNYASNNSNC